MRIAIWLDDFRNPESRQWSDRIDAIAENPDEVLWAKGPEDFYRMFEEVTSDPDKTLVAVFFDNDLGHGRVEGRHCFTWMEQRVRELRLPMFTLDAQTGNPAAKRELRLGFQSLRRFWRHELGG